MPLLELYLVLLHFVRAERKWVTSSTVLITRWKMNSSSSEELTGRFCFEFMFSLGDTWPAFSRLSLSLSLSRSRGREGEDPGNEVVHAQCKNLPNSRMTYWKQRARRAKRPLNNSQTLARGNEKIYKSVYHRLVHRGKPLFWKNLFRYSERLK